MLTSAISPRSSSQIRVGLLIGILTSLGACAAAEQRLPSATTPKQGSDSAMQTAEPAFWGFSRASVPPTSGPTSWGFSRASVPRATGPTFWGFATVPAGEPTGPTFWGFSAPSERRGRPQPSRQPQPPVATQR